MVNPLFLFLLDFARAPDYDNMRKGRIEPMNMFTDTLKKLRTEKGFSQIQLAKAMFVNNATISRWESGHRLPSADMIARLAKVLEVDVGTLLSTAAESDESPNIIMVDDNKVVIADGLFVLGE